MTSQARSSALIEVTRQGRILVIALNKPERMNAVDPAMAAEMAALAPAILAERKAGVIVVRGNGPAFLAGGDITSFVGEPAETMPVVQGMIADFHTFVAALREARQLVVGSIHGAAAGGGLSLLLACDFVVAAEGTWLRAAYGLLGTSPDGALTYHLTQLVGARRALRILLLDDRLDLAEAMALGLVTRVVPPEALETETMALAATLAANAAPAVAETKALVREAAAATLADQMSSEMAAFLRCMNTVEFAEGVAAFLAKRKPRFASLSTAEREA